MQEVTSSTLVFSTTPVRMDTSPSLFFYRNPSPASTNIPLYHPAATGRRLGAAPSGYGQNREQARPGQKKRQSAAKKTQSPVIQDNDRQRTRLLKKISALYRHYREHRFRQFGYFTFICMNILTNIRTYTRHKSEHSGSNRVKIPLRNDSGESPPGKACADARSKPPYAPCYTPIPARL